MTNHQIFLTGMFVGMMSLAFILYLVKIKRNYTCLICSYHFISKFARRKCPRCGGDVCEW